MERVDCRSFPGTTCSFESPVQRWVIFHPPRFAIRVRCSWKRFYPFARCTTSCSVIWVKSIRDSLHVCVCMCVCVCVICTCTRRASQQKPYDVLHRFNKTFLCKKDMDC